MKPVPPQLHTPILIKTDTNPPWPHDEPMFHLLSRDGLFLCRNHPFFVSSVPITDGPSELAPHRPFLQLRCPKLPQRLLERVVGFFNAVGARQAAEAAVLLAWDRHARRLLTIVPEQCATVDVTTSGFRFPVGLHYEVPPLPPHLQLVGDIHSHVDGPAYASFTDKTDELHRPGLHLVVGRIREDPPEFHCEFTVDGFRFGVPDLSLVVAGYQRRRRETPASWLKKVRVNECAGPHPIEP